MDFIFPSSDPWVQLTRWQVDWLWAVNSISFHILGEYPSCSLCTLYLPPFFLSARLPSAPHSLFCTPFISSLWQASYLVTIDIREPYRGEGQMRHRRKWWLFFICGLSRPLFHQVSVCTFGEAKCFYWTSTHSRASWVQIGFTYLSMFSPPCSHLSCLPPLFASPSFPHPFPKESDQLCALEEGAEDGEKD